MHCLLKGIFFVLFLIGSNHVTYAASCCISANAFGVGRLASFEYAAVGMQMQLGGAYGRLDADGAYHAYRDYVSLEWRTQLFGIFRLHDRLEVYAQLPFLWNIRSNLVQWDQALQIGDMDAGLRITAVRPTEASSPALPLLWVVLGATFPTGRFADASLAPLLADVSGRGSFIPSISVGLEWSGVSWFVRPEIGFNVPLAFVSKATKQVQRFGPSLAANLAVGKKWTSHLLATLVFRFLQEMPMQQAGKYVLHSDNRDFGLGVFLSYVVPGAENWAIQAGLDVSLPFAHLLINKEAAVRGMFGFRYSIDG